MSTETVDTKTVEMRFDNKKFESNVKQSMSTLEKLKRALKLDGASKGLKEVEETSKKLDFKDLHDSVDKIGKKFSALETIATGVFLRIGMKAADAGLKMVKSLSIDQTLAGWNKYAEKTTAVQTIMANLREDTKKFVDDASKMDYVNRQLERLMWFSDETSYSFTDMTGNVGKFVAVGQDLEESVTAMQGIATWAAISGQNTQTASRAMYNISQAMGLGAMTVKDWVSIENANMATAQFKELAIDIAEKQGKIKKGAVTIQNFRESLSGKGNKGWLDEEVMMEVFQTYGGATEAIRKYSEENDMLVSEVIREIKEGNKEVTDAVGFTADFIGFKALAAAQEAKTFSEAISATADATSTKWMQFFETIFGNYREAKELWTDFAEDLYDIFAAPLNKVNSIMSKWKRGFFGDDTRLTYLDYAYEAGEMDELNGKLGYISKSAAELAVTTQSGLDGITYTIETLDDGTQKLIRTITDSAGNWSRSSKIIYDTDKKLLSGRELLLGGFKNILDTLVHDVKDKNGEVHLSLFGAFKKAFAEVFFGGATEDSLAKKLWELTKRFKEFTDRLKPSAETIEKIKNVFKGLFTIFKIGYKFVSAITKPFKELFNKIFGDVPKGALNLADSMSSWIQEFEKFLDEGKIFDKISNGVRKGLDKIRAGVDWLFKKISGLHIKEFLANTKNKVVAFFKDYDFKGKFEKVGNFFANIINQIKQVETGDLSDKLTPLQNFWIGLKNVFQAIWNFIKMMTVPFKKIGEFISGFVSSIYDAITSKKTKTSSGGATGKRSVLSAVWEGIKKVFEGIVDFFNRIKPALKKIWEWLGQVFGNIGDSIAEFAKNHDALEIIEYILKGAFLGSLTGLINSVSSAFRGIKNVFKSFTKDLDAIKGVLKAYQREVNASAILKIAIAIGVLAASLWVIAQIPADRMEKATKALETIVIAVGILFTLKEVFSLFKKSNAADVGGNLANGGVLGGLKDLMTGVTKSTIFGNDGTAKFLKVCLGIAFAAAGILILVTAIDKVIDVLAKLSDPTIKEKILKAGATVLQIIVAFGIFALFAGVSHNATSVLFAAIGAYLLVKAISNLIDLMANLGSDSEKMKNVRKFVDEFKDVFLALEKVATYAILIVGIIAVIQAIIIAFASFGKANTKGTANIVKQFGKNFTRIAVSLIIAALALGLLAVIARSMKPEEFGLVMGFIIAFVSIIAGVQAIIVGLTAFGKKSGKDVAKVLEQFGKNFTRIALSLLIVAAAFAIFSWIKFDNTPVGVIAAIYGVFLLFTGALLILAKTVASQKKSEYFAKVLDSIMKLFLVVAASLIIVAGAFGIFAAIKFNNSSLLAISIIFTMFIAAVGLFSLLAKSMTSIKKSEYFVKNMQAISLLFLAVSASLLIVAGAFAIMASLPIDNGKMAVIGGMFAGFIVLVGLLAILAGSILSGKADLIKTLATIAGFMVAVSASLLIMAEAFAIMASLPIDNGRISIIGGMFAGFIILVGLLAILAGSILSGKADLIKTLATIAGFMVAVSASLLIVAGAFAIMASLPIDNGKMAVIGGMFAGFIILVGLLAILAGSILSDKADLIKTLATVAGFMVAVSASLLIVAGAFAIMASLPIDNGKMAVIGGMFAGFLIIAGLIGILAGIFVKDKRSLIGMVAVAGLVIAFAFALQIMAKAVVEIGKNLSNSRLKNVTKILIAMGIVLAALVAIGAIAGMLPGGALGIAAIAGLILAIGLACGLAAGGIALLVGSLTDFITIVTDKGPQFAQSFDQMINGFLDTIINAKDKIRLAVSGAISGFALGIADSWDDIVHAVTTIALSTIQGLVEATPDMVRALIDFINMLADVIEEQGPTLLDAVERLVGSVFMTLDEEFGKLWAAFKQGAKDLFDPLTDEEMQIGYDATAYAELMSRLHSGLELKQDYDENPMQRYFDALNYMSYTVKDPALLQGLSDLRNRFVSLMQTVYKDSQDRGITLAESWLTIPRKEQTKFINDLNSFMEEAAPDYWTMIGDTLSEGEKAAEKVAEETAKKVAEETSDGTEQAGSSAADKFLEGWGSKIGGFGIDLDTSGLSDMTELVSLLNIDPDKIAALPKLLGDMDLEGVMGGQLSGLKNAIELESEPINRKSTTLASNIKVPITNTVFDAEKWGQDLGDNFNSGVRTRFDDAENTASEFAQIYASYLEHSEPDKGPLSNDSTYAPDMVESWCKGIRDKLGLVDESSHTFADHVKEGLSTALDYVSGLIDGGMTDELVIRPIMDLSEIQNGVGLLDSMLSDRNNYSLHGTAQTVSSAAYGMKQSNSDRPSMSQQTIEGDTYNNTFNITNNDPDAVAQRVSRIIQQQVVRKQAVWAR